MLGKTNSKAANVPSCEHINIMLITNQPSHEDVVGAIVNVSYDGFNEDYVWEGEELTLKIPEGMRYMVSFSNIDGYASPSVVSYRAVADNARNIKGLYRTEVVTIVVSADGNAVDAPVMVDGVSYTGSEIHHKVPFGRVYEIIPGEVSGYITPASQSFTANNASRLVEVAYVTSALTVEILSNQSNDLVIGAVKATVSYGDVSLQVANGEKVVIPVGSEVMVSFPEVEGYRTPNEIIYTHDGGNVVKSGTYETELVTVNVTADQGTVTGFEVTISKQETVGVSEKYVKLEYIESTGTQYIDTGFKMNQNTRVVMKVKATSISANAWAFEGRTSTSSASKGVFFYYSSNKLWNVDYNGSSTRKSISGVAATDMLDIDYNKNVCTINEVSVTHTAATFQSSYNLTLLAANTAGTVAGYLNARLYSCQIYDNETLIRDYIPAMNSDGVAGLYDAVNDTFYVSGSADNFVAGANNNNVVSVQTTAMETYKIPYGTSYTITPSSITEYNVTAAKTYTAGQTSRSHAITYTLKTYTLTVKVSGLSSGFTLTVKYGSTTETQTATSATYTVSHGSTWSVTASNVNKYTYTGTSSGTMTANKTVTVTYSRLTGVFIATSAGNLVSPSSWTSSSGTAVGIAVITDNVSFIMDKTYENKIAWYSQKNISLTDYSSSSTAATDYNGNSNTDIIISELSDSTLYAAGYTRSKTISYGGTTKTGYLGSAGEWQAVIDNQSTIQSALDEIRGFILAYHDTDNGTYYWSSTERNTQSAWIANFYSSSSSSSSKLNINRKDNINDAQRVVPFYAL